MISVFLSSSRMFGRSHPHRLRCPHLVTADHHVAAAATVVSPLATVETLVAQLPPIGRYRPRRGHRQGKLAVFAVDADLGKRNALLPLGVLILHPGRHPV